LHLSRYYQWGKAIPMDSVALLEGLKAAAEPTRLRLLALCAAGELTVSEITQILGQSQPRVSRHLKVLRRAGLLQRYREQHWVYHRVPLQGAGAKVARSVLMLLSDEDPRLQLDRQRLEAVLDGRAETARRLIAEGRITLGDVSKIEDEASMDALILKALHGEELGELLDIGTGGARMLRLLGDQSSRAVGIDISRPMLMLARSNLHAAGLDHLMVRHGNMYQLRFSDDCFDTVTIDQVLFQAAEPGNVLGEAARVLRPGGRLLLVEFVTDENMGLWESADEEISVIDEEHLRGWLLDAGMKLEVSQRLPGHPFPVIMSLARKNGLEKEAVA
jgi:SAM-dependent methyltransferase